MPRSRHRTPLGLVSLALLPLLASWACGSSSSEPKAEKPDPTPKVNSPVRVVIVSSPNPTGSPWEFGGKYSVRVEDAAGQPVGGVHVQFQSEANVPGYRFTPIDTTSTDASGIATVGVFYGERAGPDRLFASATGVAGPATVDVVVTPGPPMWLNIDPYDFQLFPGDSATFQAHAEDGWHNIIPNAPFDFVPSDPTLVSITAPASPGGTGVIHTLRAGGTTTIKAMAAGLTRTVYTRVYSSPRTACTGIATPQSLAVGVLTAVADTTFCLETNASGAGYALMMYNASTDGATSLGTTMTALNIESAPLTARIPAGTRPTLSRSATLLRRSSVPQLDARFHERLLRQSRSLRRLFGAARAARSVARPVGVGRIRGPSYTLNGAAPAVPAVDDLVALNVGDACTTPDLRTFRVEAVGAKAIVLADTANPTGGFSRADYQRFATRFDTLVYPIDVGNFDAPSDIDGNGHVAILFTRAVNELTPANAGAFIGGYFNPRDLFPRTQSPTLGVCPTSNEGEMFYMMVPDPAGTVNGNQFRLGFVDTLTTSILTHEFQHLINAGRRLYVNTAASDFEEIWLDEGLSHIAEELLYFKESGLFPRSRLTAGFINDSWAHFSPWVSDDAMNFVRFEMYLSDPANHSPFDANDDLETRGATWAFLRFAVDRTFPNDIGAWKRFANSTTTGIGTLSFALPTDPRPLMRDFAVANMKGVHPSWDFASVYSEIFVAGYYPLPFGGLQEGIATPIAAKGGSASYYRFGVRPGTQALLKFGASGSPPNGNLTFLLVREY